MCSRPDRNGGGLSRRAGVVYLVGRLLIDGTFAPLSPLQAADYGSKFYASQSVLGVGDERLIMADIGGGVQSLPRAISLWNVPGKRSAAKGLPPSTAAPQGGQPAPCQAACCARYRARVRCRPCVLL